MADKRGARYSSSNKRSARYGAPSSFSSVGLPVLAAAVVVALVLGVLAGKFILGGNSASNFAGQTTVSEADLDKVMATYSYNGKTGTVTVREAIESQVSLDSVKDDEGNYTIPAADDALAVARNRILAIVAENEGVSVSDDELSEYAEKITGESDIATLASNYSLTENQAKEIVRESAVMYKLKDQVVSTDTVDAPTAPTTPEEGQEDAANATYGAYIVSLLGDEWDSANGTWARTDGSYYEALKDEVFSEDSATYAQAQAAYYVAYQQYASASSTASSEWTAYVNQILATATITLNTLTA